MEENCTLEELAASILSTKGVLNAVKKELADLELQMAEHLEGPEQGSKTHSIGQYKAIVKRGFNTTADIKGMRESGATFWPVVTKEVFDKKLWESICTNHPQEAEKLYPFITTKPAKTSVTITKVEE